MYRSRPIPCANNERLHFEVEHRLFMEIPNENQTQPVEGCFELIDVSQKLLFRRHVFHLPVPWTRWRQPCLESEALTWVKQSMSRQSFGRQVIATEILARDLWVAVTGYTARWHG